MASLSPDPDERFRPADPKNTRSPKAKSSSLRHKTRSPADAVRESELALRQLLEDFEEGRLNAFGNSDMLQKMNEIRGMQEKLTLKHFQIDQMRGSSGDAPTTTTTTSSSSSSGGGGGDKNEASLQELTHALQKLGTAIQSLHAGDLASTKRTDPQHQKKVVIQPAPVEATL